MDKIFRYGLCFIGLLAFIGCSSENPLYEQIIKKISGRSLLAGCQDNPSGDSTTAFTVGAETVAHWAFNEGKGNTVHDLSGHGHTLNLTGTFSWGDCSYGTGIKLGKGSGSTPFSPDFYPSAITVEAMLSLDRMPPENLKTDPRMMIVAAYSAEQGKAEYGYELRINRYGIVEFAVATGVTRRWISAFSRQPITINALYHIAGTYDGSTIKVFVNGVCVGETPHTGTIAAPAGKAELFIANRNNGWKFWYFGVIDEVRISNSALY